MLEITKMDDHHRAVKVGAHGVTERFERPGSMLRTLCRSVRLGRSRMTAAQSLHWDAEPVQSFAYRAAPNLQLDPTKNWKFRAH